MTASIPTWLQSGEIVKYVLENGWINELYGSKSLKYDLIFHNLLDVLECIDTCLFLGVEKLPREIYDFCRENPSVIEQIDDFPDYEHFIKTDEFQACRICATAANTSVLLCTAILENNMACIRYAIEDLHIGDVGHFQLAIKENRLLICKYIINHYPSLLNSLTLSSGLYYILAEKGACDMSLLSYLREKLNIIWPYNILTVALNSRNIEFAKYAIRNGCKIGDSDIDLAIRIGAVEVIQLLERNYETSFV